MFSLQEYQHVHLLWFKKRSFTLVWKPNPPLRSAARNGRALLSLCIRAASALPLLCSTRAVWNQALLKRLHLISEIFLLLQCAAAGSARALEQRRPCTSTSATTSNFYSHTLKKWSHFGRSLEPWIYKIIL